jgi:hypothetical protein
LHNAFVDIILTKDIFQIIYKNYLRGIKLWQNVKRKNAQPVNTMIA